MKRPEAVALLAELARLAYWYGERTGDYTMTNLFEEDEEAMSVAEEVAKALQDKQIIIDHLKAELMRALSQYDMVAAHNAELKAQVEDLRNAGSALRERWDLDNILGANTRTLVLAWGDAVNKTAEQCLAEVKEQTVDDVISSAIHLMHLKSIQDGEFERGKYLVAAGVIERELKGFHKRKSEGKL